MPEIIITLFAAIVMLCIFLLTGRLIGWALGIGEIRKNQEKIIELLQKATREEHWSEQYRK
jgi:hypothetical protein